MMEAPTSSSRRRRTANALLILAWICLSLWLTELSVALVRSVYQTPACSHDHDDTASAVERTIHTTTYLRNDTGTSTAADPLVVSRLAHANVTVIPIRRRIYTCGYEEPPKVAANTIFSDFEHGGGLHTWLYKKIREPLQPQDVLVYGMHKKCGWIGKKSSTELLKNFPGKILYMNGESWGNIQDWSPTTNERLYQLGPYIEQQVWQQHTMQLYFLVMAFFMLPEEKQQWILDPALKPHNTGRHNAVAYFTSNCVPFRQEAATAIAKVIPVHYTRGCPLEEVENTVKHTRKDDQDANGGPFTNDALFHNYTFCLVMENKNYPGYITEKILNAFLGGCIPIYYGTTEIFDIFHKDSFVFYDIDNPQPALQQLARLQSSQRAYRRMLHKSPILASPSVIEEYFSLSDDIGGGKLKQRIRDMMDIRDD
ncbi:Glycosyltransferase family 10 (fucosyltransferase) [Seminavis robusta]|uniref:Fucosyltransferase n=1 Tax=Seminavis robusta TaxID=568900 RepID=A0A9N8DPA0_9STRA|nr:Glycosyltransferase family 10 (fucosyltransferase) [Seminavis robusta]|eukprot:Sro260_g101570.1 Glycosyltransferase family 10 (fucosyltransferase) (425) ;mRNA; r:39105-40379